MGFFDKVNNKIEENLKNQLASFLLPGEQVEHFFIAKEDFGALTDKRVIFVDRKITSSKKTIIGIPYPKISGAGLTKGGAFTITKEVVIMVGSHSMEIETYNEQQALEIFKRITERII